MAEVFISFIHEEGKITKAVQTFLKKRLEKQNIFLSSDKWQVFAGELWLDRNPAGVGFCQSGDPSDQP